MAVVPIQVRGPMRLHQPQEPVLHQEQMVMGLLKVLVLVEVEAFLPLVQTMRYTDSLVDRAFVRVVLVAVLMVIQDIKPEDSVVERLLIM